MVRTDGVRRAARPAALLLCLVAVALSGPLVATVSAKAKTAVVPRDYPTIQAAVDAAAPGDTVIVKAGTYAEQVAIGKDLDLRGAGVGATVITAPSTMTGYGVNVRNGRPWMAIVEVGHGANAGISGLTISGPVPCGTVIGVTAVQAATLQFTDAAVRNIQPATTCSGPRDVGVQIGAPPWIQIDGVGGTTANALVANVEIDSFLSEGIEVTGPGGGLPSHAKLTDNTINAGSPQYETEQFGVVVFLAAVAEITGNTISGGVCNFEGCGADPILEFQAMGVIVESASVGTTIADNHISGSDVGVYQYDSPNCCRISNNKLTDNRYFGIVVQDGDGTASKNKISGSQVGIGVVADAVDTTAVLSGNKVSGTTVAPVSEIECCGVTATAIVQAH